MGSRALRKLQREQLEKQLAASQSEQDDVESEEEEEPAIVSKPRNAFDMLEGMGEEDEDSGSDHEDNIISSQPSEVAPPPASSSKSKKKKKKSKKKQNAKAETPALTESKDVSEDEIDKALKELSLQNAGKLESDSQPAQDAWEQSATAYLSIDQKNLDPVNEMRGLFGNIALEEDGPRTQPTRQRDQNLQGGVDLATALGANYSPVARGKKLGALAKRRNCFVQGKEDWPMATSGGLSMEAIAPTSFERQYNIMHNNQYKEAQWQFEMAVESMQVDQMIANLRMHPYHIASLLQVSEIAKHQGDSSLSGDLLERALFTFGRSVHSSFPAATRGGTARLSFDKPANRELYLTIWRYMRNLEQRGTWKTAFEWSKLLLQMNTVSDPFGATLMIDQLALRGRQHEQFLHLASDEAYGPAWSHLPNIQISKTLALLRAQKPKEARQQLALAMHHYPYVLSALASAIEVTPIPKSLWGKTPSSDAEKLYTDLYVTRAKDLWNTPETIGLISEVANTLQYYKSHIDQYPDPPVLQISLEEARHIMALEIPTLIALLPRKFTTMPTSSTDVLPPPSSEQLNESDLTRRAPANASRRVVNFSSLINRMVEWFSRPADATDRETGQDRDHGAENLVRMREFLGEDARDLPDDILEQLYYASVAQRLAPDDEEVDNDLGIGAPMAGGFDYYEDNGDGTDEDMPDLEDPESQPEERTRGPHAATVEEEDDEDAPRPQSSARVPLAPIIRHVDDADEDQSSSAQASTPETRAREALRHFQEINTRPTPPASTPQPDLPTTTDSEIEADPQRLQRWLISTGLEDLKSGTGSAANGNKSTYVRRLKMLNKNQQTWILTTVRQRGSADLASAVESML